MSKDRGYGDCGVSRPQVKKIVVPPVSEISPRLKKSMEEGALDSAHQIADYISKGIEVAIVNKTYLVKISIPIRYYDGMSLVKPVLVTAGYTDITYRDNDNYKEGEETCFRLQFLIPLK